MWRQKHAVNSILHSSIEQWTLHFTLIKAAVHRYWVTVLLYEMQRFIGKCSDTSLLSFCFAEQQVAVGNASCLEQCRSALVLGH